jgi:hypothetical protein
MAVAADVKKSADGLNAWKSQFRGKLDTLFRSLGNNPKGFSMALEAFTAKVETDLQTIIQPLLAASQQLSVLQTGSANTTAVANDEIQGLVKFADYLDEQGAYALADKVTEVARLFKDTQNVTSNDPVQPAIEASLSTRYCPDHCGAPIIRISDRIFQCSLDGKIYDFDSGYVNYKGQRVPGGSISEQTPSQSDCGGIPMRVYDPSQNSLSKNY